MIRFVVVGFVLISLIFIPVVAYSIDDLVGLYFDDAGDSCCAPDGLMSLSNAYLIVKSPTDSTGICTWELTLRTDPGVLLISVGLTDGAMNFYASPSFLVGCGANPIEYSDVYVLATVDLFAVEAGGVYIDPLIGDYPKYSTFGGPYYLHYEYLDDYMRVATIGMSECPQLLNSAGIIHSDEYSWGQLKALFR